MICGTTTSNVVEFNSLQGADTFLATSPDEMNVTSQTSSRQIEKVLFKIRPRIRQKKLLRAKVNQTVLGFYSMEEPKITRLSHP